MNIMYLIFSCLIVFSFSGCSDTKELKETVETKLKTSANEITEAYEQNKIIVHAKKVIIAVESDDLKKLRTLCNEFGNADYKEIMKCFYKAIKLENEEGVDKAHKYITDELSKKNNSSSKGKALKVLNVYFEKKGGMPTKEVAAIVLIIALEAQYPHRGAVIGGLVAKSLGIIEISSGDPNTIALDKTKK